MTKTRGHEFNVNLVTPCFYWSHPSESNRRPADYEFGFGVGRYVVITDAYTVGGLARGERSGEEGKGGLVTSGGEGNCPAHRGK